MLTRPYRTRRTRIAAATLFCLLVVVTAFGCSDESSSGLSATTSGSYETCEGFIDSHVVEEISGSSGLKDRQQVIEIASIPGLAESGATSNCLVEVFRTLGGDSEVVPGESVIISIVNFESSELALNIFNSALAAAILTTEQVGDPAEIEQEVIGPDSYLMEIKAGGIGAIIVYVANTAFISMSSTTDALGEALLDGRQLVTAGQGIKSRLP
jgi:hypothetical protein